MKYACIHTIPYFSKTKETELLTLFIAFNTSYIQIAARPFSKWRESANVTTDR